MQAVNQINYENFAFRKDDEEELEKKMLVANEGDSAALNETELQQSQRKVMRGARSKSDSANTLNNNVQELADDNQYSTLDRTNKQQESVKFKILRRSHYNEEQRSNSRYPGRLDRW